MKRLIASFAVLSLMAAPAFAATTQPAAKTTKVSKKPAKVAQKTTKAAAKSR